MISSAPADFATGDLEDLGPASSGRKSGEAVDTELIAASIKAREHRSFAGRLDRERLGLAERALVSLVHADDGDFRDWDAVQDWTRSIAETLLADERVPSGRIGLAGRATDQ